MAEKDTKKDQSVEVPLSTLTEMQEQMAKMEKDREDDRAKMAGLEAMLADSSKIDPEGGKKIREKKSFEPAFRTVKLRKYPIAGDDTNIDYVVGWTKKGAYQEVDRSGVSPQVVDYIEVIFSSQPKKAEKIRLLDFLNKGVQVVCKIIETKKTNHKIPTGEEIDVTIWDPKHGLMATGDKVDGFHGVDEITYTLQVPGLDKPVEVNGDFVNA